MKRRERFFRGSRDTAVSEREIANRAVAYSAAVDGIVLLKNDGLLPLKKGSSIGVFGGGAGHTVKGGTGSGDVNEREVVSIYQGLKNTGFKITSSAWIENFDEIYRQARQDWKKMILEEYEQRAGARFFQVYSVHAFEMPKGRPIRAEDVKETDTAVYVISRTAGEGADRRNKPGDYKLSEYEENDLELLSKLVDHIILVLNAGGQIDLNSIMKNDKIKAILSIVQPGMEGGNALADILCGNVTPSGKLTDTWAKLYSDYPNAASFSHNNGDVKKERYEEGIYVGYRYFDSFKMEPFFAFGYGLSYTDFSIRTQSVRCGQDSVTVSVVVENVGDKWAGKEVVQVYATCPQTGLPKEYKRLCGFAKTQLLSPGEQQSLTITFPAKALASFDEEKSAWTVGQGLYGIWVGNSSDAIFLEGVLEAKKDFYIESVEHICPLQEELDELIRPDKTAMMMERRWHEEAERRKLTVLDFVPDEERKALILGSQREREAEELTYKLTEEQCIAMVVGEISKGQGQGSDVGDAGVSVPGAAGETSSVLEEEYDVPGISMADGPAVTCDFIEYCLSLFILTHIIFLIEAGQ